jgi:hypothetical protein
LNWIEYITGKKGVYIITPSVCVSLAITLRNSAPDTEYFDVINTIIIINIDYFPKHYLQLGLYNGNRFFCVK